MAETNRDFSRFESRNLKMEEIFQALKHDEINLIGVCGMGGVGKTTLVNEVAKRAKEDNDEIAIAVVGQKPNLPDVRASIASMLGLKTLPDEASPIVRADLLRRRLQQDNKKVLVVLDDVWEEFDLQAMGIPLDGANKNLKMLYTSRTRDLWHDVPTKKQIPLELLSEDEAWQLFREKVGDSADARNLQPIARKIVNECGRLPLALVLIGSALSKTTGGNAVEKIWDGMLHKLTRASSAPADQQLSSRLQLSYEYLENEGKHLFLLCCLFEEDENICVEDLARYGLGLSLFDGTNDMEKVRNRVFLIVDGLKSRYLLLDGSSYKVRECVKVHDVVRDMGISIAAKTKFALVSHGAISRWPKTATYEHCTAISVISDEIEELPEGLTYPKLEFLMLRCRKLNKLPPNFFEGMQKLKVLELRDFGGVLTLQSLRNLTTLSLEGFRGTLDNVSLKGGLPNLEILNLRASKIEELPEGIDELFNLRVLDLTDTRSLIRIPSRVISRLVRLEELYFLGSDYIWRNVSCEGEEEGINANLGELELVSNLNTLEIVIDCNAVIPEVPIFSKLKQYKVVIGGGTMNNAMWEIEGRIVKKCKRFLSVESSIMIPPNRRGIGSLLRSGDCLVLDGKGCNDLVQALLLQDGVDGLQQLKYLMIGECDTPECLAITMSQVHLPAVFPILKALDLRKLDKLREICRGPVAARSFGELASIHVEDCKRLENLFQQPIVGYLTQLKHLIICNCDLMEQVISKENQEDIHDATNSSIVFPKLEVLKLEKLPNLMGFCRGIDQMNFPQLKKLYLDNIPQVNFLFHDDGSLSSDSEQNNKVRSFSIFSQKVFSPNLEVLVVSKLENLESLGHRPLAKGLFSKLKKLVVSGCPSLKNLFHPSMARSFFNLQELVIYDCLKMEVVIDKEEEREGTEIDETQLSSLVELELSGLPKLRSFWNLSHPLEMPLLSKMDILDCPSLDAVSFGYVRAPILPLEGISWDNDVKKAKQALEQIRIPCLEDLEVSWLENGSDLSSSEPLTSSLYKLGGLTVRQCSKLLCGFPSHLLLRLQRLQELKVEGCESLEVIFKVEGLQSNGPNPEIFFSLKSVKLCYLPKLNCISKRGLVGLKNIKILEICECNSLTYVFAPTMTKSIPQLCELKISGCEILSRIVAAENGLGKITVDEVEFPRLEKLELHNLPNLLSFFPNVNVNSISMAKSTDHCDNSPQRQPLFNKKVAIPSLENLELTGLENVSDLWCSELSTSSFSKLKQLEVSKCTSLRNMFHPSMAKGLVNLEKLFINNCSTLEAVVGNEGQVGDFIEVRNLDYTLFPQLANLGLNSLPNLMRFCHFTYPLKMPLVTKIDIFDCPNISNMDAFSRGPLNRDPSHAKPLAQEVSFPKLEVLQVKIENLERLGHGPLSVGPFSKLKELSLCNCSKLVCVFPSQLLSMLQELQKLTVERCDSLEVVLEVEGVDSKKVEFPQLKSLELLDLPKLFSFFRNGDVNTTTLGKPTDSCNNNNPQQPLPLFNKKVVVSSLEYLGLRGLKNVSDIWCGEFLTSSFSTLKRLEISHCISLRNIFHTSTVIDPQRVAAFFPHRKIVKTLFPQLGKLQLINLPKLQCFSNFTCPTEMPLLSEVDILSCPELKKFSLSGKPVRTPSFYLLGTPFNVDPNNPVPILQQIRIPCLEDLEVSWLENGSDLSSSEPLTSSLYKLGGLTVRQCSKLLCGFPSHLLLRMQRLQELKVESCESLEVIFEVEGLQSNGPNPEIFFSLKSVKLCYLPKLNCISKRGLIGLKNIKILEICECKSLTYVFAPTMTKSIPQLCELKISGCEILSRIVAAENGLGEITVDEVEFPRLEKLELHNLPNLLSFFPNVNVNSNSMAKSTDHCDNSLQRQPLFNKKVAIPSLENLELTGLKNVSNIWDGIFLTSSFSTLKHLEISNCTSLINIFHPSTVIVPQQNARPISGLTQRVAAFFPHRKIVKTLFPQLGKLQLISLPKLQRFSDFTCPTEMPLLSEVDILSCPELKKFSRRPVSTPSFSLLGTPLKVDPNNHVPILKQLFNRNLVGTKAVGETLAREAQPHEEASSSSLKVVLENVPEDEVGPLVRRGRGRGQGRGLGHVKAYSQEEAGPSNQAAVIEDVPQDLEKFKELQNLGSSERDFEQLRKAIVKLKLQIPTQVNAALSGPSKLMYDDLLLVDSAFVDTKEYMDHMSEKISQACRKFKDLISNVSPEEGRDFHDLRKAIKKLKVQIPSYVKIRSAGRGQGRGLGHMKAYSQEEAGPSNQAAVIEDVPQDLEKFKELQNLGSSERDFEQLRKAIVKLKLQIPTQVIAALSGPSILMYNDLLLVDSAYVDTQEYMDHMSEKISQAFRKLNDLISKGAPEEDFHDLRKDIKKLRVQFPSLVKIRPADSNRHPYQWPNINDADYKMTQFFYKDVRDPGDTYNGNSDGLWKDFSALPQILRICLLCFFKFPPEAILKRTAMIYMWIGLGYTNFFLNGQDNENYANEIFDYLVDNDFIESIYQTCSLVPDSCRMSLRVRAALYHEAIYLGFTSHDDLQLDLGFVWGQSCLVNVGQANLNWELEVSSNEARNDANVSLHHSLQENAHHIRNLYIGRWQGSTTPKGRRWQGSTTPKGRTHHIELTDAKVLDGLKNMKILKFLSLRGISMITELPTSMVKLKCLEILDLRACHNLEAIPENIGMLESLTHLDMSECYFLEHMPESLSQLSNLKVLKGFVLGDEENKQSCTLLHLSRLQKLRKLNIHVSVKNFEGRWDFDHLKLFDALQKLTISWGGCSFPGKNCRHEETGEERRRILPALCTKGKLELPKKLQKLDIRCFPAAHLADWFNPATIEGLKKLYIQGGQLCRIGQAQQCQGEQWNVEILRLKYLYELEIDWSELRKLFHKLIYLMYKAEDPELPRLPPNKKDVWEKLDAGCPKFSKFQCNEEGTVWMSKEALRSDKQLQKLQKYLLNSGMISSSSMSGLIQS